MTDSKMKLGSNLMVAALATTMALLGAACDDDVFTGTTTTTGSGGTTTTTVAPPTTTTVAPPTTTTVPPPTTTTVAPPTTTTTVPAGPPPLIGALTVELDFSAGATITACTASFDALFLPGGSPLIATGVAGSIATIGAIHSDGMDASAGLIYVSCTASGPSATSAYGLTITEAKAPDFADISANVAVVVSSTDGSCHPSAGANDLCLTVTTSP